VNFFERQATVRRTSRQWVGLFVLAVIAIVTAVDAVVVTLLTMYRNSPDPYNTLGVTHSLSDYSGPLAWTTVIVLSVIVIASLYKSSALSAGGSVVAIDSGGVRVDRDTADPANKRLLNIVEEISIASGVPMPQVYILEQEPGINAFAAGYSPANAVIAVTRGAVDTLTRSELQGVIAHEFSHLLNGDMRLNIKLMGLLFGILVIALAGRLVLRFAPRGGDRKSGGAIAVIVIGGLAIMAIGYIGLFFGRLIQAAVARNRESLADASAVQFTRDPLGLRGALVKIGATEYGSRLVEARTDEIAHLLFAPGMTRLFATHPPLVSRLRTLDPNFRESEFAEMRKKLLRQSAEPEPEEQEATPRARVSDFVSRTISVAPVAVTQLVGAPAPAHIESAQAIFASLPDDIVQAVTDVSAARALLFALALDEETEVCARQLKFISTQLGSAVAEEVGKWLTPARGLKVSQRQPALLRLFPALRKLSESERAALIACLSGLLQREGTISVDRYALLKLAQVHLRESLAAPPLPGRATLNMFTAELAILFAVLAQAGAADPAQARIAYEAGMAWLLPRDRPEFAPQQNWSPRLDAALNRLDRLLPAAKELLIQALVKTIASDGKLMMAEAELLRGVCATLHCPLPPLAASPPAAQS
jgi:Zn-dependent protease with chaperone function